jgi:predicted DNA-binding protein
MDTTTVTTQIPADLAALLTRIASAEDRSKSYYVRKGLEMILRQRLEDIEDYESAVAAHAAFEASGEAALTMDQVFGRD